MDTAFDGDVEEGKPLAPRTQPTSYGAIPDAPAAKLLSGVQKEQAAQSEWFKSTKGRSAVYSTIRAHSYHWNSTVYRITIRTLIAMSVFNFLVEDTMWFEENFQTYFFLFELLATCLLLVEYAAKISTAHERTMFKDCKVEASWKFISTDESLIDVLSWLPFFVILCAGGTYDVLRIWKLVRLLKLDMFWSSFRLVHRVLYYNKTILVMALTICFFMLLVCSILLYYMRPAYDPKDNFSSILACMYLSVLMLTGQGEPNGVMPWYTRIIICVTAIFAIAQFAIPASMLTWGFENEAEKNIHKAHEKDKKTQNSILENGGMCALSSSSSGESDRHSEWEGYLKQLLGSDYSGSSDSDAEKPEKTDESGAWRKTLQERGLLISAMARTAATNLSGPEMKRAKQIFRKLDENDDGIVQWSDIRGIAQSNEDAKQDFKELKKQQLKSFKVVTGDESADKVKMPGFFAWLGSIKVSYPHKSGGGEQVLHHLLQSMEDALAVKYKRAHGNWKKGMALATISTLGVQATKAGSPAANLAAAGVDPTLPKSKQLKQIAESMEKLEGVNSTLRDKVAMLEKELQEAQAALRASVSTISAFPSVGG